MKIVALILLALVALPASGDVPIDRAREQAAVDLYRVLFPVEDYPAVVRSATDQIVAGAEKAGHPFGPDQRAIIEASVREAMPYDDVIATGAGLVAQRFSTAEIVELERDFQSSALRRFTKQAPEITRLAGVQLSALGQRRVTAILQKKGLWPESQKP